MSGGLRLRHDSLWLKNTAISSRLYQFIYHHPLLKAMGDDAKDEIECASVSFLHYVDISEYSGIEFNKFAKILIEFCLAEQDRLYLPGLISLLEEIKKDPRTNDDSLTACADGISALRAKLITSGD